MSGGTAPDAGRGALAAAGCYFCWGLFPLYWKLLADVDAAELIAHRHIWSLAFVLGLMAAGAGFAELRAALRSRVALQWHALSGTLLTINWLVYVWGVNHGHILETSLGYFLVPLVNVALGRLVLHERLRPAQWIAIGCAALGVGLTLVQVGRPPWIALTLAATFGVYGLLRKKSPLGPLTGLGLETLLLLPFAVAFVIWQQSTGAGALGRVSPTAHVLLVSAGRGHGGAAAALCLRRAPHPPVHPRAAAVHRPHGAIRPRRLGVPRAVFPGPRRRLRLHLVRARALHRRQSLGPAPFPGPGPDSWVSRVNHPSRRQTSGTP